jgi:D-alanyl-D-alanine carboxypeptidase (penicillin-binding protein 5/6)
LFASATATAQPSSCPNKTTPPKPVDTSENPKPGQPSPGPIAVPDKPAGGTRMAECGVIAPPGVAAPPADVTPQSWILADVDTGQVLGAKDPHARQRPASLIKVLLAVAVLDEVDMNKVITGTQEDANQDGTRVGMGPGGQYTAKQLLFALLMRSGNDAAHALARQLGTIPQAVAKMNATARKLGALDTQTASPSGLDGPGMMTSSYDMALFYREAMKHPEFAEAISTKQIDFPGYADKPGYKVNNDNRLLGAYPGFLGGKTGFTDDARHTYLGGAKQNGHRLVVVLMRGEQQPVRMADQGGHLLDWGFAQYKGKPSPVGTLETPGAEPAGGAAPPAGASADTGNTAAGAKPKTPESSLLPVFAMSISAATLLFYFVWRIRRRRTHPATVAPDPVDPEITARIERIRD